MLALGVCFPQPCSSAAGLPRRDDVGTTTDQFVRYHKDEFDEKPL